MPDETAKKTIHKSRHIFEPRVPAPVDLENQCLRLLGEATESDAMRIRHPQLAEIKAKSISDRLDALASRDTLRIAGLIGSGFSDDENRLINRQLEQVHKPVCVGAQAQMRWAAGCTDGSSRAGRSFHHAAEIARLPIGTVACFAQNKSERSGTDFFVPGFRAFGVSTALVLSGFFQDARPGRTKSAAGRDNKKRFLFHFLQNLFCLFFTSNPVWQLNRVAGDFKIFVEGDLSGPGQKLQQEPAAVGERFSWLRRRAASTNGLYRMNDSSFSDRFRLPSTLTSATRWTGRWQRKAARRMLQRLRRQRQFDSIFERLEPRKMLTGSSMGTGVDTPHLDFSFLGLPDEISALVAPFLDNGSGFAESSISFPTTQAAEDPDAPPVENIFQFQTIGWSEAMWQGYEVTDTADDNDGTETLVQLRELDADNTLVLYRQITVDTDYQASAAGGGAGGGAGAGGGGSSPGYENRSTDALFVALVTDSATAAQIETSGSLGSFTPADYLFSLAIDHDFSYTAASGLQYVDFSVTSDLGIDLDLNWTSDVTRTVDLGDEFDNDATMQVQTASTATVDQVHHWEYNGQTLSNGDYSVNLAWNKSGSGTSNWSMTSDTVWNVGYVEGDVATGDGTDWSYVVTDDFETTSTNSYSYTGTGTSVGDSISGYADKTRDVTFLRDGNTTIDDRPVRQFDYHSVGTELDSVEVTDYDSSDSGDGGGDGGDGGDGGGDGDSGESASTIQMTVFYNDSFSSTSAPVFVASHDYTTISHMHLSGDGTWANNLDGTENLGFDTTGTIYQAVASLNSITTTRTTAAEINQNVSVQVDDAVHTTIDTTMDFETTGSPGGDRLLTGSAHTDVATDQMESSTGMSTDLYMGTLAVGGEVTPGTPATLPDDWANIIGAIESGNAESVDWSWLGEGYVSVYILDDAAGDHSTLARADSDLSGTNNSVNQYGSHLELLADDSVEYTGTVDAALNLAYTGDSTTGTTSYWRQASSTVEGGHYLSILESSTNDTVNYAGTFHTADLSNVLVTALPIYGTGPENNGGGGDPETTIVDYDTTVTGTADNLTTGETTSLNLVSSGSINSIDTGNDGDGLDTDIAYGYSWNRQMGYSDEFTATSNAVFGPDADTFAVVTTQATGSANTSIPVDDYLETSDEMLIQTDNGNGMTSTNILSSRIPWNGGGSASSTWSENLTTTWTSETMAAEDDPDTEEDESVTAGPIEYLEGSIIGSRDVDSSSTMNHHIDSPDSYLYDEHTIGYASGNPNMPGEPSYDRSEITDATDLIGNRGSNDGMTTNYVYHEDGLDVITNGTNESTWSSNVILPIDDLHTSESIDPSTNGTTETEIETTGFLRLETEGSLTLTADDWTIHFSDSDTDPDSVAPLTGNQVYDDYGTEVRVTGTLTEVEDLKNEQELNTTKTRTREMDTNTGFREIADDAQSVEITDYESTERSIRTRTTVGLHDSLTETVKLELPVGDNRADWTIQRDGSFEFDAIGVDTTTGSTTIDTIDGTWSGNDIGGSVNTVVSGADEITTTRGADGNIVVTGVIVAERTTTGTASAGGESTWINAVRFDNPVDPPTTSDLGAASDDAAAAAADPNNSGFDILHVGKVISRSIQADYEITETFTWSRVAVDEDGDGIAETVNDSGPEKTVETEVTGSDNRVIHHYGHDLDGEYGWITVNGASVPDLRVSNTDIATTENPSGYIAKALDFEGDTTLPGRPPSIGQPGDGTGEVDDSGSLYEAPPAGSDEGDDENDEGGTPVVPGDIPAIGREVPLKYVLKKLSTSQIEDLLEQGWAVQLGESVFVPLEDDGRLTWVEYSYSPKQVIQKPEIDIEIPAFSQFKEWHTGHMGPLAIHQDNTMDSDVFWAYTKANLVLAGSVLAVALVPAGAVTASVNGGVRGVLGYGAAEIGSTATGVPIPTPGGVKTFFKGAPNRIAGSVDDDFITLFRGDRTSVTEFRSRAAQNRGFAESQGIIDAGDLDDLFIRHAAEPPKVNTPFISLTDDPRVAEFFATRGGTQAGVVHTIRVPRHRVRFNSHNQFSVEAGPGGSLIPESEFLIPNRVRADEIIGRRSVGQ